MTENFEMVLTENFKLALYITTAPPPIALPTPGGEGASKLNGYLRTRLVPLWCETGKVPSSRGKLGPLKNFFS